MKIVGFEPKDNNIKLEDIFVDVYYDRHQKLYSLCLRDKNTQNILSDYQYARDKKEAQFTKSMMQDDIRNYLDDSYNLIETLEESGDTFTFPNLQQAIDFFFKDKDAMVEKVSIDQLVKDNDLLNDEDLQSYHQRQWDNKKASEFSIDKNKANNWRLSEVPYAIRHKDGTLELGDGRHRTRALYNDGYKYVEIPVINESMPKTNRNALKNDFLSEDGKSINQEIKSENTQDFNIKEVYHCRSKEDFNRKIKDRTLWFSEDLLYSMNFGENIFTCNLSLHNPFNVGNTDLYIRDLIPTKFSKEFIDIANRLDTTPEELLKYDSEAKRILSIVGTVKFSNLVKSKGYDGITSIEDGNRCYAVFNLDQVEVLDIDLGENLNESVIQMNDKFKKLIDECIDTLSKNGLNVPTDRLDFRTNDNIRRLGVASYPKSENNGKSVIGLSNYMNNMSDEQIKNTIYHELGHILSYEKDFEKGYVYVDKNGNARLSGKTNAEMLRNKRRLSHHGKVWQDVMQQISKITGQSYQRLANAEDTQDFKDATKDKFPYQFECPNCHVKLRYSKRTDFVKNFDKVDSDGTPWWWCGDCAKKTGKKIAFVKLEGSK